MIKKAKDLFIDDDWKLYEYNDEVGNPIVMWFNPICELRFDKELKRWQIHMKHKTDEIVIGQKTMKAIVKQCIELGII